MNLSLIRMFHRLDRLYLLISQLKLPIVFFVDELRKLEDVNVSPSTSLSYLIKKTSYDTSEVALFASSLLSKDFGTFTTESRRDTLDINFNVLTSIDRFMSPLMIYNNQLSQFLLIKRT